MAAETKTLEGEDARRLRELGEGLQVLIRFHDREVDSTLLKELHAHRIAEGLAGLMVGNEGPGAVRGLVEALDGIGTAPDEAALDSLAAEYADLYLTHGYRVSPSGSVWLTEDKLERQLPMFDVRDWYAHYGIKVPDWRVRADDHIVHELEFVAYLCRLGGMVPAIDAGRFMDLHVLPWVPEFCARAAERVKHPLYRAVMHLTAACLEELRAALETITGVEREVAKRPQEITPAAAGAEDAAYVPGLAEGW